MKTDDFLTKMEELKTQYYKKNTKNTIFKKTQKIECAQELSTNFDMELLYSKTFFIIPNTNKVFVDYTVLKEYAHPSIYMDAIHYFLGLILNTIRIYNTFDLHINLNSFTISAAERYKNSIILFCNECVKHETQFANQLDKMYIYYTPSVIESIMSFFSKIIAPEITNKVVIINKSDSDKLIQEIFLPISKLDSNELFTSI
jgi:hypothetical protein